MQILNTESATSPTDLIAGLFARVAELQGDHFRAVAGELNAFLAPTREACASRMPDDLDIGYDAMLFWGLTLKERIDVEDGMTLLSFEQIRAFVDEKQIDEFAPQGAGFHHWQFVGAIVRTFRWKSPNFTRPA